MNITYRTMTVHDAAAVAELSGQLGYTISVEQTAAQIALVNSSVNDVAYVAVDRKKVVGWMHVFFTLRIESAPFCEIGGMVVDEAYRGNGIGKALVDHAIVWCASKGCDKLRVRSNIKREAAHRFYERAGFEGLKQQKAFTLAIQGAQ